MQVLKDQAGILVPSQVFFTSYSVMLLLCGKAYWNVLPNLPLVSSFCLLFLVDSLTSPILLFFFSLNSPLIEMQYKVSQLCPSLCDHMDCSLPGSSVHETLQARILEWLAVPFSRLSIYTVKDRNCKHD